MVTTHNQPIDQRDVYQVVSGFCLQAATIEKRGRFSRVGLGRADRVVGPSIDFEFGVAQLTSQTGDICMSVACCNGVANDLSREVVK